MSESLQSHGPQYARIPCPSLSPRVCSDSCPLSWWCCPTMSYPVVPLLLLPSVFPSIKVFPTSWLFASGGRSTEASVSASVLPMNILCWYPLGLIGLISQTKGLSSVFSSTTVQKHQFFSSVFFMVQLSHLYMITGKTIVLSIQIYVS